MLINPPKNAPFKQFLENLFSEIEFFTYSFKPEYIQLDEYRWSIALGYLLLKCFGDNPLAEYLNKKLEENYETYKLIFIQKIKNVDTTDLRRLPFEFIELYLSFFETGLINPFVLRRSLFLLRTDMDLKALFCLFGGNFYPQEQEFYDGTGALYFTKSDKNDDALQFNSKIEMLQNHLRSSKDGRVPCIAVNTGGHWVAVDSIEEKKLYLHNPSSKKPVKISLGRYIPEIFRFYLFDYTLDNPFILKENVNEFLREDIEKEQENMRRFLDILVNSLRDHNNQNK